ncbi:MAG: pepsin/retropepsin-like aspartic protease family protein [Thermoanaerobaculia bacterium]
MFRNAFRLLSVALLSGCALYSDVSISPLFIQPGAIDRGSDLPSMVRKSDFMRAVALAETIDGKANRNAPELAALGAAELAAGRFDVARKHLRAALDLNPFRTNAADIAWNLSQVEYLSNNYEASLEWAHLAAERGIVLKKWHLDFLEALSHVRVYRFSGAAVERLTMRIGRPDIPRIEAGVNGVRNLTAIVDSGAVLSIVSRQLADQVRVRSLGIKGTFTGLLGEAISVEFGLVESLQLGRMVIENVPVAIMADDKMRFMVTKSEFKMDLLLGANLLKEMRIELDFRRRMVTFAQLTPADRNPAPDQNLFFDQFRPAVRGVINRKGWFLFILDTGSEVTFLNEAQYNNLPIQALAPKAHTATLQGLGGATKHGSKVENVEIGLDRWAGAFRDIPMYDPGVRERTSGIIGENYLKNFVVLIDFGRMRVDLVPMFRVAQEVEGTMKSGARPVDP